MLARRGGSRGGVLCEYGPFCLGCQLLENVDRTAQGRGDLLGQEPCFGMCDAGGLLGLNNTQRGRLKRACHGGRWTSTEVEFVRWEGKLPKGSQRALQGLSGAARDDVLTVLMEAVDEGLL